MRHTARQMPKLSFFQICRTVLSLAFAGMVFVQPVLAEEGPTGLPLPRFVSTRSEPINVRVGPGIRYDVAWTFKKAGLPVEIIQEFDVWRKIRYVDGEEGWIHQNLLSSRRSALVQPAGGGDRTAMRAAPDNNAQLRAWLGTGFLVSVNSCKNGWCAITTTSENGVPALKGNVLQTELWGVFPDEKVE